jgi:hypothetical protein
VKTAGHFTLDSNQLLNVGTADDGYDNIELFRTDTQLDVQIDVDVMYPATDTTMLVDPTVSARMTDASVTTFNTYDGYTFYVQRGYGAIAREEVNTTNDTELDGKALSPALEVSVPYHIRFTVTGTTSVTMTASVTRISDGTVLQTWSATDSGATRFPNAGHAGIGAGTDAAGLRWDNYVRTPLP